MKTSHKYTRLLAAILAILLSACAPKGEATTPVTPAASPLEDFVEVDAEFTLKTGADNGNLVYVGIGGEVEGIVNPDLLVHPGDVVRIHVVNGDGMPHDLFLPDFSIGTAYVSKIGEQTEIVFSVGDAQPGSSAYYCTVPGHRQAGQEGKLIVAKP